ncbi:ABC transporter branched-chain amino acid-binding protein LivK [Gottschalkia acidurici 9a]|uniref:ABC transporter branched-chain amino acid-binding protein LivK n=1 Tax=Gottschalkia acidurici (strain ATCC 7906 / DSM 604 / BCRC 14475 / CIP 104303 / KCTC 5404 / NCIMB 10678 / 9a) TaxID=1128398 RepID=K0AZP0_GOTA9|nr:ABC transporter substrate-binding protein [Gottschalkia acidurici]AFS78185.1 ABC transporter branched-chain amino acid-binding protein LivK [Gottschalkia acidurici 9a]
MSRIKKLLAVGMTLVMSATILAGCGQKENGKDGAKVESDVIKIGAIAPETGEVAVYGKAALNGYKLAIEQYNEKGGVLGKQVKLIPYDDKGDDNEAVNAYNRLVSSDKVDGILGAVISTNTSAIAPLAAREGIPMITATSTADKNITEEGENIFRSCYTDTFQGSKMAEFAGEDLKAKTAAIIYNTSSDYSDGLAKAFKETFEKAGGKVVASEGYTKQDKDFKSILTSIKGKNADVLVIPDYYEKIALITKQAREVGIESTFLGGDGWDGVIGKIDNSIIEKSYFSNHYATDDTSEVVQNFIKAYEEKYKEKPSAFAALGYDAATTLLEAMNKAGSTDREKVVEAMKNTDLELVSGHTKFDKNRNPIKPVSIIRIGNGENKLEIKK